MKDSNECLWLTVIISAIMATLALLVTTPVETARADGSIIYVDRDATGAATGLLWTDAYTNLQDALSAATTGTGMPISPSSAVTLLVTTSPMRMAWSSTGVTSSQAR
jgi:hypothetical protein